ncbi:MAG TPA: DUF2797 domain-containing protein [Candidatus Saccharimonas sp.]|nr:DUF2797 domain-containing protein [Candidatus Saccharimonas sp.]
MPNNYLFVHYGFDANDEPVLTLLKDGAAQFEILQPRGQRLTFTFDKNQRFCPGWHDLASSASHPCPTASKLDDAYNQCMHCQRKTGFNPAFYNAASVSPQQQARNALPHFLYLAHFAPGVVKVGISWSGRGVRRLLEQGARSYLIVKEYPNANVARQYEAKIAALAGIAETLTAKVKYGLLEQAYDLVTGQAELLATRERLKKEIGITPDNNVPVTPPYLQQKVKPSELIHVSNHCISGNVLGMVGSALVAEQNNAPFYIGLAPFVGYMVKISDAEQVNSFQPKQIGLF